MNVPIFAEKYRGKIGVVVALTIIIISKSNRLGFLTGFLISSLGNLLRVWASGYIRKERELATSGPYSLTRNPLYLGNFLIGAGFCIASWQIISIPIFFLYFLLFYIPLIRIEEKRMKEIFGEDYIQYKKSVPVFFPRFGKIKKSGKFSLRNFMENKEWRAIISTLIFYLAILLKEILVK